MWHWPKHLTAARHVFSRSRERHCTESFKASGSECFSIYPILRCLILVRFAAGEFAPQVASILALFIVLDGYSMAMQGLRPDGWEHSIAEHMRLFKVAYPNRRPIPKFHYALHSWRLLVKFGVVISCWVHERKHQAFKDFARYVRCTAAFERSLSQVLVNAQLEDYEIGSCFRTGVFLLSEKLDADADFADLGSPIYLATSIYVSGLTVHVGDLIWLARDDAEVVVALCKLFLRKGSSFYAIVDVRNRIGGELWRVSTPPARELIAVDRIKGTAIHKPVGDDAARVLLPCNLSYQRA